MNAMWSIQQMQFLQIAAIHFLKEQDLFYDVCTSDSTGSCSSWDSNITETVQHETDSNLCFTSYRKAYRKYELNFFLPDKLNN